MVKAIVGVIVGYIVMFVLLFACFTGAYLLLGVDNAFRPGVYDLSHRWMALSLVLHLVASAIAGLVCAAIAKGGKAPMVLAGLVLVLGLLFAIPAIKGRPEIPNIRSGDVPNLVAMQRAKSPVWFALAATFVAAIGVLAGSRLKRQS
jgi:ABC-type uncharacterized transport system permease subunit